MDAFEERLGYRFQNRALLNEALTHASMCGKQNRKVSNQRLEFLGDAVLQLVLSEALFQQWPQADEGWLSKHRTRLVSATALAGLARELMLGDALIMAFGEEANGGRNRDSILADAMEAVFGAIYLDGGLSASQTVLMALFGSRLKEVSQESGEQNNKGVLQELLQDLNGKAPTYHVIGSSGPDHERLFDIEVRWNGQTLGQGSGRSKKLAEMAAAADALLKNKHVNKL